MTDKPRVVFDCNVLLQATAREKSAAAKCLNLAESGLIQICVSREVLAEAEDVLNRPEIRSHFPDLSDEIVGAFLKRLRKHSTLVRRVPKKFSYPRDDGNNSDRKSRESGFILCLIAASLLYVQLAPLSEL